jgi:PTH1 family peptidyl-tRNA hydrolase
MKLIVGLGNPGKNYIKTRHNVGFMVLDEFYESLKKNNISKWELSKKFNSMICGCEVNGQKVILAKPMTFMNESGQTVQLIAHYYNIVPRDIIVVHDDKDIKLGELKVQTDRGHAGHNGVRSIIEHIGSQDFTRVRIGIASENAKKMENIADFVLKKFGLFEKATLEKSIAQAIAEIIKML